MRAEHHAEQRVVGATGVQTERAGQLLDRDVLVGQCPEQGVGHLVDVVHPARGRVEPKPQRHGVDEHPDGALEADRPVADRGADHQLAVAAVPAQQFAEEGEQGGERGVAVGLGALAQPPGEVGADRLAQLAAAVAADRAGPGQAGQHQVERCVPQLPLPELQARGPVAPGPGPGVLLVRGGGRQPVRLAQHLGAVHREQVAQQDRERVPVVDQVVLDVHQPVVVLAEPDQVPAQQRRLAGVQRFLGLGAQQPLEGGLGVGLAGQVAVPQPDLGVRADPLVRKAAVVGGQLQPQAGVVGDHGGQSGTQRGPVQRAPQVERGGEVVGAAARQQLLVQPDDLLRGGESEHGWSSLACGESGGDAVVCGRTDAMAC